LLQSKSQFGGFEPKPRRGLGIVEDAHQDFDSAGAELVEIAGKLAALGFGNGGEFGDAFHPTIDGDAVDVVRVGGSREGRACGEGVEDLLLEAG